MSPFRAEILYDILSKLKTEEECAKRKDEPIKKVVSKNFLSKYTYKKSVFFRISVKNIFQLKFIFFRLQFMEDRQ